MEEKAQQMFKSKICGSVQEVIFPEFPDDDNTVTTTVTKSRRVSFGTNFIKEFIVGSAVSAQCVSEYEQAFSSSDSSNLNSSHSAVESDLIDHNPPFLAESLRTHPVVPPISKPPDFDPVEHAKPPKFSRTICFSADSPTADMEFTEGCITLAKSILDKKNKEMTVIIQAKSKEPKEEERSRKEDVTKFFEGSQLEMSVTSCLKSKENKRDERKFESEKTKIFNKFDDEMSITRCDKLFKMRQSKIPDDSDFMTEDSKENRMPLDLIMRQLDRDDSDSDLFNPHKSFSDVLDARSFDLSSESEKLDINESMDISKDFHQSILGPSQEHVTFDEKTQENVFVGLSSSDEFDAQIFKCQAQEMNVQMTSLQNLELVHDDVSMEIENQENLDKRNITNLLYPEQTHTEDSFRGFVEQERIPEGRPMQEMEIDTSQENMNQTVSDELLVDEQCRTTMNDNVEFYRRENIQEVKTLEQVQSESRSVDGKVQEMKIDRNKEKLNETMSEELFDKQVETVETFTKEITQEVGISEQSQTEPLLLDDKMPKELLVDEQLESVDRRRENIQEVETTEQTPSEPLSVDVKMQEMEIGKNEENLNETGSKEQQNVETCTKEIIEEATLEKSQSEPLFVHDKRQEMEIDINQTMPKELLIDEQVEIVDCCRRENIQEVETTELTPSEPLPVDVKMQEMEIGTSRENLNGTMPKEHLVDEQLVSVDRCRENIQEVETTELTPSEPLPVDVKMQEMEIGTSRENLNGTMPKEHLVDEQLVSVDRCRENIQEVETTEQSQSEPALMDEKIQEVVIDANRENLNETGSKEQVDSLDRSRGENIREVDVLEQSQSEPLLVDVKMIENLEEQSKESNCIWTLQEVRYARSKALGLLTFNCTLLQSPTIIQFTLKKSTEGSIDSCSVITDSSVHLKEEATPTHPEYNVVLGFGFKKQEEYFNERKEKINTIRHVPYFLDEINSFMRKINSYLRQVYQILISYPGSSLQGSVLSFRLFSYPIFFSSIISIDLTHLFRLSDSSLSFKHDFGNVDEKRIRNIFQDCLKHKNCLCEFVIRSSEYIFDIERRTGFVSKRSHVRLLPAELRL